MRIERGGRLEMKTVFLHGLGQTAHDWDAVLNRASLPDVDCPELSTLT